jgi:hypothetical protein
MMTHQDGQIILVLIISFVEGIIVMHRMNVRHHVRVGMMLNVHWDYDVCRTHRAMPIYDHLVVVVVVMAGWSMDCRHVL